MELLATSLIGSNGYFTWEKGKTLRLTKYFTTRGITCPCSYPDCLDQKISQTLLGKIELVRIRYRFPILVTSGFRCAKHQVDLKEHGYQTAQGLSQHELGNALDITAGDLGELLPLCEAEFKAIGISRRFLHVDMREDKTRRWRYSP